MTQIFFSWIHWDPHPDLFVIPVLNHPIRWYGAFFALGIALGYFVIQKIFNRYLLEMGSSVQEAKQKRAFLTDRLAWMVIIGILVGARFGHICFYEWEYHAQHPGDIIRIWEGGLASHGGAIGVLCAMACFVASIRHQAPWLTYMTLLDCIVIPTALTGCCIRIGNFFNQEILGTPTDLPWAIVFGHPFDDGMVVPRHAAQLYEAGLYLWLFIFLYALWSRYYRTLQSGILSGLFFVVMFSGRFLVEFIKVSDDVGMINTAQWLSLPFIAAGMLLLAQGFRKRSVQVFKV